MRDVPADAPLNATNQVVSRKHYKAIEQGANAYKLLPAGERERLLKQVERRLTALERTLSDSPGGAQGSCGGAVDQCVPLGSQPLLQIGRPAAGHGERRAP